MTESMLDDEVVLRDHGLWLERDNLLPQVDQRSQAVDERDDDGEAGIERPLVATEALDHAGLGLRNDPNRSRQTDDDEDRDDQRDDQFDHSKLLYSWTSAVAPSIITTSTCLPTSTT